MRNILCILNGKQIIDSDFTEWAEWFKDPENRRIAVTEIGDITISTVFLGIDHGLHRPLLFETMVFGGPLDGLQDRYETYEESELGHVAIVDQVKAAIK